MKLTKELLHKIAHLARLEIDEKSEEKMMQDMNHIISWVEKLNEVDTKGVEPLTTMSHEINSMREDVAGPLINAEEALQNAPQKDTPFFKVPKVLD